jgi:hypothetical protein
MKIFYYFRPSTSSLPPELEEDEKFFNDEDTESIPTDEIRRPVSHDGRPAPVTEDPEADSTADNTVSTTEENTGLTAAMLDKAALDLYAIFQQTQDENASNFVDENATESRLEEDEEKENTTEVNNDFMIFQSYINTIINLNIIT